MFKPRPINMKRYARYMDIASRIVARLGLTIRLHGDKNLMKEGDIFLFNHFARLETLLPPIIWFKEVNAITHSVAHKGLFKINPRLNRFFNDTGTLPTDLPGLMPYLAAQVLRGHKVMIYPEGGMIRDRKVRQDNGEYQIYTDKPGEFRKLHRGAAALAEMLNLFKSRLIQLEKKGDTARLNRWQKALEFESVEALLAAAHKPTVLVPSTLTFYPIRNAPNLFSKIARLLVKQLNPQVEDELVTEGNLLFRATDLDLHLNTPISLTPGLSKMENWLLDQTFTNRVKSLEELFALRDKSESWSDKLLSNNIQSRTDKLRDAYIPLLYEGLHLNLGHLLGTLLLARFNAGETRLQLPVVRAALYRAVHALQQHNSKHGRPYLHTTLTDPCRYATLRSGGHNRHLKRLLDIATQSGLIRVTGNRLDLLPKMAEKPSSHVIRLAHPLRVMANEAEVVDVLAPILATAWQNAAEDAVRHHPAKLEDLRWQDELNAFTAARARLKEQGVAEADMQPVANGTPFYLKPKKPHPVGVLLVHGFLASPGQLRHVAESLAAAGHTVLGARIPGHGTHPNDLDDMPPECWLSGIQRQYDVLADSCQKVVIIGFSTGGMLGLRLAARRPDKLAGVITVAAPWRISLKHIGLVPWVNMVNRVARTLLGRPLYRHIPFPARLPELSYNQAPVSATAGLLSHIKNMHAELSRITAPTLVLHADADPLCDPKSATTIHKGLKKDIGTLLYVRASQHDIISHPTAEVLALVQGFIRAASDKEGR